MKRVAIFIDGGNLYNGLKNLNRKVDYGKLIGELKEDYKLVYVYYYTAELDWKTNLRKFLAQRGFFKILKGIPKMSIILCSLRKVKRKDGKIEFVVKGDDALLIRDLLLGAFHDEYDIAIIVSGDEDFLPIIQTLQGYGKTVANAYFKDSSSQALRKICDYSIQLDLILDKIGV